MLDNHGAPAGGNDRLAAEQRQAGPTAWDAFRKCVLGLVDEPELHSTPMISAIVGFHQDDEGEWVAELTCLHGQHSVTCHRSTNDRGSRTRRRVDE